MELVFGWPEYTVCVTYALTLLIVAADNGKPRKGEVNFSLSFMCTLINLFLLYAGGFFS